MSDPFPNLADWYFTVNDTNPGTQVYATARGIFVAVGDATFNAWLASTHPAPLVIGTFGGTVSNGGAIQIICDSTAELTTGLKCNYTGNQSGSSGTFPINVDSATRFTLTGSTFVSADTTAQIVGATIIDTAANLQNLLNQAGLNLLVVTKNFYSVNAVTITGNTTLSNPLSVFNVITDNGGGSTNLSLPPMNQPNSIPKGVPFFITKDRASANLNNMGLFYNDGTTQVSESQSGLWLGAGVSWLCVCTDNSSVNGTIRVLGVFAQSTIPLPTALGGSENDLSSPTNQHRLLFVSGAGPSTGNRFNGVTVGTQGQNLRQVSSGNPGWLNPGVGHGDSNTGLPPQANQFVAFTNAALTAPRTWTLSAANTFAPGTAQWVIDLAGGVTATNTITIAGNGSDKVNGNSANTIVLNHAYAWACLTTDGVSAWSSTDATDASNLIQGTLPDARLANTITAGGPTGDASHVAQITYDAHGRLTAVSSVAITGTPPGGSAGGDLGGTYPNPTVTAIENDASMKGDLLATEIAAPSAPGAGLSRIYVDSTSHNLASINHAGTVNHGVQTQAGSTGEFIASIAGDGSSVLATPTVVQGVTDGSNASAGNVGEVIKSDLASGSAVNLSNGAAVNVTSITLTAGDWDVWGSYATITANEIMTGIAGGVSNTSATLPSIQSTTGSLGGIWYGSQTGGNFYGASAPIRVNVTTNTTFYLVVLALFTVHTPTAYGFIMARRVR